VKTVRAYSQDDVCFKKISQIVGLTRTAYKTVNTESMVRALSDSFIRKRHFLCRLMVALHFVPFPFVPGHFVPVISSPVISSPVISSPGHFVPLYISSPVISSPVILSPGHFVPWSFCPLVLNLQRLMPREKDHSYGLHRVRLGEGGSRPGDGGDDPRSGGDRLGEGGSRRSDGGGQLGNGGDRRDEGGDRLGNGPNKSDARRAHAARLDHVHSRGFLHATSKVLEDSTTDHRPVVTEIASGGAKRASSSSSDAPLKPSAGRLLKQH
jgi:hypothetical protein